MKLFGRGNTPSADDQAKVLEELQNFQQQLTITIDGSKKMMITCFNKCVPPTYHDTELNTGESVCVDRCILKYMTAAKKMLELYTEKEKEVMEKLKKEQNIQTESSKK